MGIHFLMLALVFTGSSRVFAQRSHCISGVVNSGKDHQAIPFVAIQVKGTHQTTQTDSLGRFKICFDKPGQYVLLIKNLGYDSLVVRAETGKRKWNLHLKEKEQWLDAIDVVGEHLHFESEVVEYHSVQKLEMERSRGTALGELIRKIPGVSAIQSGPTLVKPMIQGFTGQRVAILNNGVKLEGQSWGFDHAPEVDPSMAREVVVVKGAQAVRYGMEAIGGVILLEPGPISEKKMAIKLQSAYFSNGSGVFQNISAEGQCFKGIQGQYRFQFSGKKVGDVSTPRYVLGNTAMEEFGGSGLFKFKLNHFKSEVYASWVGSSFGIFKGSHISSPEGIRQALLRPDSTYRYTFSYQIGRPSQGVDHLTTKWKSTYQWSEKTSTQLVFTHQSDTREEFDLLRLSGNQCQSCPQLRFWLFTNQLELAQQYQSGNYEGRVGVVGMWQGNTTEKNIFIPNFWINQVGFYNLHSWTWEPWMLEVGFRGEYRNQQIFRYIGQMFESPEKTFWNGMGNVGLRYQLNSHLHFKINGQVTQRAPNLNEQFANGVHHGTASYERGNDQLKPEQIWNANYSIHYKSAIGQVLVNFFNTYSRNFIYLNPVADSVVSTVRGPFPFFEFKSAEVNLNGVDFQADVNFVKPFLLYLKGAIIRSWNYSLKDYLIFQPADRYESGLICKHETKGKWQFESRLGPTWVRTQTRAPANQDLAPPPSGYWLWNGRLATRYQAKNLIWDFSLECQNIQNRAYRDYLNRFRYFAFEPARNLIFRVNIEF